MYYFLVIRKKIAPSFTLPAVFLLSIVLAFAILPASHEKYVGYLAQLFPILEMVAAVFIIRRVSVVIKDYRRSRKAEVYFTDALEHVLSKELPNARIVNIVFTEIALFYYAFTGWFRAFKPGNSSALYFSYHRRSNLVGICGILLFLFMVETLVLHMIVQVWSGLAAWVLTGLGMYSFLWLLGLMHAFRLQPVALDDENIYVRAGFLFKAAIPLEKVSRLERVLSFDGKEEGNLRITPFATPNFALTFKESVTVTGPFGTRKNGVRIGIFIDEAGRFEDELNLRLLNT
jgi:hypothetical protein